MESRIANISGVNHTIAICDGVINLDNNYLSFQGINSNQISNLDINIIEGSIFNDNTNELILGKLAIEKFNKSVNDTILINGENWKIAGIFESGNPNIDSVSFASLAKVQKVMEKEGKISEIYVKADKNTDIEKLTNNIENKYNKNISVISSLSDIAGTNDILNMLNGARWGISFLAIIVGGIGIINTMIMSVYERTREIGVLKAVGWKSNKVIGMILAESIVITLIAGIVGSILGLIFIELISFLGILNGIEPILSINIFIEAIAISLLVGIIGGLYPAIKASKLHPTEALMYE